MTFYFSGITTYCLFLIYRMFQDKECSKTDLTSWLVITVASLFWIVVIPISILEVCGKVKKTASAKIESQSQDDPSSIFS